jgi:hypothetical protein
MTVPDMTSNETLGKDSTPPEQDVGAGSEPNPDMTAETLKTILEEFANQVASKLSENSVPSSTWGRIRKVSAQFAKDFGPLLTGVAAILVSLSIGALTIVISVFTYQANAKQAAANQINLRTTALNDFADSDEEKRTLAAIKVAAYGEDALPIIRFALGVKSREIRAGGVTSAQVIYQSNPDIRPKLMAMMALSFQDPNPNLRLGILEFYREGKSLLTSQERADFWNLLKTRLGPTANACSNEEGEFILTAVQFLGTGAFSDAKDYLLNIARNCPHEKGNEKYNGARNQAVRVLPTVLQQSHASKAERDDAIRTLQELNADASEQLKSFITAAVSEIQKIQDS